MAKAAPIFPLAQLASPLKASAAMLLVRWSEVIAWSSTIHDPQNVQDLHNMRIAAKRLRYTLEIFAPVLTGAESVLSTVEAIQERIGKIHDCDVLFPLLIDRLDRESKRERKCRRLQSVGPPPFLAAEGLVGLIGAKRAERSALYEEFVVWWAALPPESVGAAIENVVAQTIDEPAVGAAKLEERSND